MTSDPIDWTQEAELDPEKEYRALVRSIRYSRGFGLIFVQCSPAEGTRLIDRVREDLPTKKIEVLTLESSIDNLYDVVDALPNQTQIDALFIQGIEHSLYEYEKKQLGNDSNERYNYTEKNNSRLLGHLNLGRERFRGRFNFCLVFLVPPFALKYLIRRAPDFFDWRLGVYEFPDEQTSQIPPLHRSWLAPLFVFLELITTSLNPSRTGSRTVETIDKTAQIPDSIDTHSEDADLSELESPIDTDEVEENTDTLVLEALGQFLDTMERYEEEIALFDYDLITQPDDYEAWDNRGISLHDLGRYEEAIASYDRAVDIRPDYYEAWYNRGISLHHLERYEEAIASYDRAIEINPNDHEVWYNRGLSLHNLGRYEEAIASFDRAVDLKPDDLEARYNQALSLQNLGRYEAAIASYNKFLEISPTYANAFYNKACCYELQGEVEEAIRQLKQAIDLDPKIREWAKMDSNFDSIRDDDRFQALLNEHQNE